MKYINILILLAIISIFGFGCLGESVTTSTPVPVATVARIDATATPEAISSTPPEIPKAKEIKPDLKEKVDKLIDAIVKAKDWSEASEPSGKLDKICEGNKTDIPLFAYLLESPNVDIASKGLDGIRNCSDEAKGAEKFEVLIYAVKYPSDYVRYYAIGEFFSAAKTDEQKEKAKELCRTALNDPSGHVRYSAIGQLGYLEDEKSIDKFKEMMKNDPAPEAVAGAIEALDRLKVDVKADLMKIMDTGTPYVKCYAINVLSDKKDKDLIPILVKMLDDKTDTYFSVDFDNKTPMSYNTYQPTLQKMAIQGLETITGEKFKGAKDDDTDGIVKKWKEWAGKNKK